MSKRKHHKRTKGGNLLNRMANSFKKSAQTLQGSTPEEDMAASNDTTDFEITKSQKSPDVPLASKGNSQSAAPVDDDGVPLRNVMRMPVINIAFNSVYMMLLLVVAVLYLFMTLNSIWDLIVYSWREAVQVAATSSDDRLMNRDTTDMQAFQYISINETEKEPYNIFMNQTLVSYIFVLLGVAIIAMGIHLGLFVGLQIYATLSDGEFQDKFEISPMVGGSMAVIGIATFILHMTYNKYFLAKTQPSLKSLRVSMLEIRDLIFSHMSSNEEFLSQLWLGDIEGIKRTLRESLARNNFKACNNPSAYCDKETEDLVFTLNVFSYFRQQIPESDPAFDIFRNMMSSAGISSKTTDISQLFYYKQSVYIPNMYSLIRSELKKSFVGPAKTVDPQREKIFIERLTQTMQDVNTRLSRLYSLPQGKRQIARYMIQFVIISLLFLLGLGIIFWKNMQEILAFFHKTGKTTK